VASREGAFERALRMAAMSVGVAGSYAGYMTQRPFLGKEKREGKLKATHANIGRRMADELATLRGPAMKLGQALSLQTGLMPEAMLSELTTLQMHAPAMHPSLMRAQFKASMGAEPERIFRTFEDEPFAAASLGQVHRAVTRDGNRVAVKIQYPGIQSAIASDFKCLRALTVTAQLTNHIPKSILDETEQQIAAETDYRRESENITFFHEQLRPLGYVNVPNVFTQFSSEKVLTMSFVQGDHLDAYLGRRPAQEERDLVGSRLLELFYFQLLRVRAFHADPHWGNYFFSSGGTIGLVDFGCVKYLTREFVNNLRATFLYPGDRQSPAFRRLLEERWSISGIKLKPAVHRALVRLAEGFYRRLYPPDRANDAQVFDFADGKFLIEYARESTNLFRAKAALPEHVFFARAETGLYQTLHRLKARVPTSRIVRQFLQR